MGSAQGKETREAEHTLFYILNYGCTRPNQFAKMENQLKDLEAKMQTIETLCKKEYPKIVEFNWSIPRHLGEDSVETTPHQTLLHAICHLANTKSLPGRLPLHFDFIKKHSTKFNFNEQCGREQITPLHVLVATGQDGLHFVGEGVIGTKEERKKQDDDAQRAEKNEDGGGPLKNGHNSVARAVAKIAPTCYTPASALKSPPLLIKADPKNEWIEYFLAEGADPFLTLKTFVDTFAASLPARKVNEYNALHLAVMNDYVGAISEIVARYPKIIHTKDRLGRNALSFACQRGNLEVISILLAVCSKEDKDAADNDGFTPIYYAVFHGHVEVVKFLIKNNIDFAPSIEQYAAYFKAPSVLSVSVDRSYGTELQLHNLFPPLPLAVQKKQEDQYEAKFNARLNALFPGAKQAAAQKAEKEKQENPYILENYICGKAYHASSTKTNLERVLIADACMLNSAEIFQVLLEQTGFDALKRPLAGPFPYECTCLHILAAKVAYTDRCDEVAQNAISKMIHILLENNFDPWGSDGESEVKDSKGNSCFEYALNNFLPVFSADPDELKRNNFVPSSIFTIVVGESKRFVNITSVGTFAYFIKSVVCDDPRMKYLRFADTPTAAFRINTDKIRQVFTHRKGNEVVEVIFEDCHEICDADMSSFLTDSPDLKKISFFNCSRLEQEHAGPRPGSVLDRLIKERQVAVSVTKGARSGNDNHRTNNSVQMNFNNMFNGMLGGGNNGGNVNLDNMLRNMNVQTNVQTTASGNFNVNINGRNVKTNF